MIKAHTSWFTGARSEEQKKEIHAALLSALPAFKRLIVILEKNKVDARNATLSENKYDSPSWALIQADAIGEERAINHVIKLLNIVIEEAK